MLKALVFGFAVSVFAANLTPAFAAETAAEKGDANARTVKRKVKKGAHRAEEAVCTEGDAACAAKKGGHHVQEGAEAAKDKTKAAVDKVD